MVNEIENTKAYLAHARDLNRKGWLILFKKFWLPTSLALTAALYGKYSDLHIMERRKIFYNRSKMHGGLKNPQY